MFSLENDMLECLENGIQLILTSFSTILAQIDICDFPDMV